MHTLNNFLFSQDVSNELKLHSVTNTVLWVESLGIQNIIQVESEFTQDKWAVTRSADNSEIQVLLREPFVNPTCDRKAEVLVNNICTPCTPMANYVANKIHCLGTNESNNRIYSFEFLDEN